MVELQALAQTEDEMNLLTLRLENVSERFNKLEAEVGAWREDAPVDGDELPLMICC